ncbi:hypothetical protein KOR42_44430 [Thalassoglobus neptunius]|uniref:Uncharacterized protein n=1 Tax=Thalassoglobus neptunius TaxID=1938619 RepID=A0A5C5W042_9PLAN|nr:hypothetical protein [Thalassoglobus neptunius]TWT43563.1 hypothetical protein KOR42_44430 [Thalassoglobus neptunius]
MTDGVPQAAETSGAESELSNFRGKQYWLRGVVLLVALNALFLAVVVTWVYFDSGAPSRSSPFLNKFRWWSQPWGVYVPAVADALGAGASQGAAMLGVLLSCFSLLLVILSLKGVRNAGELVLPIFAGAIGIGWLLLGVNWDVIRLRGQSMELARHVEGVSEFARQLEEEWPDQDGEIEGFGAFLGYPYGTPRTLLMLGEACVPKTELRIAAVERTPGESIRFQLSGGSSDVWFEWRVVENAPASFAGGLQQNYSPKASFMVADKLFLVRYALSGPEPSGSL